VQLELGSKIEAAFLLKIGTIFKALVDRNPYSKVHLLSTEIEDFSAVRRRPYNTAVQQKYGHLF
jgi:hypothetical protein